jgi:uncharacterized protein
MAFLLLGIAYLLPENEEPMQGCLKAGGVFGLLAAFLAWYAISFTKPPQQPAY